MVAASGAAVNVHSLYDLVLYSTYVPCNDAAVPAGGGEPAGAGSGSIPEHVQVREAVGVRRPRCLLIPSSVLVPLQRCMHVSAPLPTQHHACRSRAGGVTHVQSHALTCRQACAPCPAP